MAQQQTPKSKPAEGLPLAPALEEGGPGVIAFYSDKPGKKFREFSNFFSDAPAFRFQLPAFARSEGFPESVHCEFAEKAIMATKAALMKDEEAFAEIEATKEPKSCKALGRSIRNFDQALWDSHLEDIAFEVVKQKFEADPELRAVLLSTGNATLVEAAPHDCIWGVGMGATDEGILDPTQWRGRNVLGYALVRARTAIRADAEGRQAQSSDRERQEAAQIPAAVLHSKPPVAEAPERV